MQQEVQYRLADDRPICMECNKPFDEHTQLYETRCRSHAKRRNASLGNMMYLNTGFRMSQVKTKCMVKDCEIDISVPHIPDITKGQTEKYTCEEHSGQEYNEVEWKDDGFWK